MGVVLFISEKWQLQYVLTFTLVLVRFHFMTKRQVLVSYAAQSDKTIGSYFIIWC